MSASSIKAKLQIFIRSYHKQQLIQGLLSTTLQALLLFYLLNYTEYLFWLESNVRGFLFYGFWISLGILFFLQVLRPLFKMLRLHGNRLSEEAAARIIGNHFSDISDKLLNLLQLEAMGNAQSGQSALLLKSIEQKTQQLNPFTFTDALNWPEVRKSVYRFLGIIAIMIFWGIYDAPSIAAATNRLLQFQKHFDKPAPFQFQANFKDTQVQEKSDLEMRVTLSGSAIPDEVYVHVNGQSYLMRAEKGAQFRYTLPQIAQTAEFYYEAAGFESPRGRIDVIAKFELRNLQLRCVYPSYLQRASEVVPVTGMLQVPIGTQLEWEVQSQDAEHLWVLSEPLNAENGKKSARKRQISPENKEIFTFKIASNEDALLKIWSVGKGISSDTFLKQIQVIPDAFPQVQLEPDASAQKDAVFYVVGNAIDDYGIQKGFVEYVLDNGNVPEKTKSAARRIDLKIAASKTAVFSHVFDLKEMVIEADKGLKYRVGITDNDALAGGKTAFTDWQFIRRSSEEEVEKQLNISKDQVEKQLADAQSQAQKLQKQSDKLKQSMSMSPQLNSDMQEKVQDWLQQQEEQLEKMSEIKKEQERIDEQQKEIAPKNEELKERREELNERLDRLEDPKIQELLKELQELLSKKKSPQEVQQKMDQLDRRMQSQKDDMEQLLEQLKELRVEEQIDLQASEMQEWVEKQEKLQKQTEDLQKMQKNTPEKELQKQALQEALKQQEKEAAKIEKRADEIEQQNKKLQAPMPLDLAKPEIQKAGSEEKKAGEELQKNKPEESKQNQKKAAEQMKEAAQKMQESLEKAQKQRNSEDMQALRALLENLIEVSYRQERIFTELSQLNSDNPRVRVLNQEQMNIKNMSEGIEDSLRALAKRQPMVSDLVTREITDINDNMERAFEGLKVRDVRKAASYEQFVMTGYNNLAVMLMESLKNVQQRMNQQQSSSSPKNGKMCENPKPGNSGKSQKGKGSKLSEAQKQLGEKLQQMQQQGKEGKEGKDGNEGKEGGKEGEKKSGSDAKEGGKDGKSGDKGKPQKGDKGKGSQGDGSSGERMSDKDWVEMVLMQESLRRKIEALRKEALKEGKTGQAANLFEAEKLMEEQEKKWVQKKFDAQMMWRQKQIETRLLEHEKAQMKQEQEEKRESKTGDPKALVVPPEWLERQRRQVLEKELLQRGAPQWQPYYREKSAEYLRKIQP